MTNIHSNPTNTKAIAYAYSRFSSTQQAGGDSKRRQDSFIKAWPDAEKHEIRYLHDPSISAYCGKNRIIGHFGVFLASLRRGILGSSPVLLVENLDRISREELETAQTLFLEIVGLGAVIITLHNGKRYAKGMGLVDIITALVEMDVAHQHSAKLSMRVKAAFDDRKRSGGIVHNRSSSPRWLRLDARRTHFEPIPERVEVIRRMFDLAVKGMGAVAIARVLTSDNVPIWSGHKNRSKIWRCSTVSKVLFGRSVLGEFEGRPGYFGQHVVPPELWARVNDRVRRAAQGRGRGVMTEGNLLRGLVFSGLDGSRMILRRSGVKNRKTKEYRWHAYLVGDEAITGGRTHRVRYAPVEERLLWLLTNSEPEVLARARSGVRGDCLPAALGKVQDAVLQGAKYYGPIEINSGPLPVMVADFKRHEATCGEAETALVGFKFRTAAACAVPTVKADLSKPENRRALRAEIAQWCDHIEILPRDMVVWFSECGGLKVNLEGEPSVTNHVRKEPKSFDVKAGIDAVYADLSASV